MAKITDYRDRQPTNDEQIDRRQSAPRQTLANAVAMARRMPTDGSVDGFRALDAPIGEEAIRKATQTLMEYKQGKTNLENRIIDNEKWYKLRHWESMRNGSESANDVEPTSGWLFNCIANKHADAMDNYPSPNVLPREEGDKAEAEMLSSIIPVILEQNDFEGTYDDVMTYKLKSGTGVYGIFWDSTKLNGLGDISIKKIDLLSLFWEPGIQDIQRSRNLFSVELMDNDLLLDRYPQLAGKLSTPTVEVAKYVYDDTVDVSKKSLVIDWFYKKRNMMGQEILHYCKYVNNVVLFATENEPAYKDVGWYTHAKYPFVFDPLFKVEGTPAGFGYIDVGKSAQEYIDRGNKAIMQNMLVNARPRFFVREDGEVNEQEFADTTKDFVHVQGNMNSESIAPIVTNSLPQIYVNVIDNKVNELKETTGNRDISTGGTTSGVTAASAIAAMQEAGSKLSRDSNKASYRAFREICLMVIELIRQYYDAPRCFRIMGNDGVMRFAEYSNANLLPQYQGMDFNVDMGYRVPLFDIEITASKQSPYSKMAQNELALQFYGAGFFAPQNADQALACLDMMDFDRKEFVMQKIQQNGTLYNTILALQQQMLGLGGIVDATRGDGAVTASLYNQFGMTPPDTSNTEALGGNSGVGEAENTKKARQRVADSTTPN